MEAPKKLLLPRVALVLGMGCAVWLLGHLAAHWSYYTLPLGERPLDPRHSGLRPSGHSGLLFGIVGTAIMLLNLTYLVRKRLRTLSWLGALRTWMGFHVLTGLVGPGLILLHTAFAPTSALGGLALGAMLIVVGTGLMGRYIYARVPRSYRGRELELEEVRRRLVGYREELEALGVNPTFLKTESRGETTGLAGGGILSALRHLIAGNREAHRQFRELERRVLQTRERDETTKEVLDLLRKLCRERQWVSRYHELRGLMGAWRFFHRWLAVVLFLVVAFHIALAVRFGDLWILKGD